MAPSRRSLYKGSSIVSFRGPGSESNIIGSLDMGTFRFRIYASDVGTRQRDSWHVSSCWTAGSSWVSIISSPLASASRAVIVESSSESIVQPHHLIQYPQILELTVDNTHGHDIDKYLSDRVWWSSFCALSHAGQSKKYSKHLWSIFNSHKFNPLNIFQNFPPHSHPFLTICLSRSPQYPCTNLYDMKALDAFSWTAAPEVMSPCCRIYEFPGMHYEETALELRRVVRWDWSGGRRKVGRIDGRCKWSEDWLCSRCGERWNWRQMEVGS